MVYFKQTEQFEKKITQGKRNKMLGGGGEMKSADHIHSRCTQFTWV